MKYKFTEVLNDLVNYFLLGDIQLLEEWKKGNNLSDNLAMEFTTTESAEAAVCNGIILPMAGIENYPYTIILISKMKHRNCLEEKAACNSGMAAIPLRLSTKNLCCLHGGS